MTDIYRLQLFNSTFYSYSTSINGIDLTLTFIKNSRNGYYYFTATLRDGTNIIEGMKLVSNFEMLTSKSFEAGLNGYFLLIPRDENIKESVETMDRIADNFIFGFVS